MRKLRILEHFSLYGVIQQSVYPVLLGTGMRIFAEGTPPRAFELVSTKALASGVILSSYKPNGPLLTRTKGA